jgi:hypothetical protein
LNSRAGVWGSTFCLRALLFRQTVVLWKTTLSVHGSRSDNHVGSYLLLVRRDG